MIHNGALSNQPIIYQPTFDEIKNLIIVNCVLMKDMIHAILLAVLLIVFTYLSVSPFLHYDPTHTCNYGYLGSYYPLLIPPKIPL